MVGPFLNYSGPIPFVPSSANSLQLAMHTAMSASRGASEDRMGWERTSALQTVEYPRDCTHCLTHSARGAEAKGLMVHLQ
jgi:hypothetical protein